MSIALRIKRSRGSGDPLLKDIIFAPTFRGRGLPDRLGSDQSGRRCGTRVAMAVAAVPASGPLGVPEPFHGAAQVTRLFDAAGDGGAVKPLRCARSQT